MTARGAGSGDGGDGKRGGAPPTSELQDDPLLRPASDAGWNEDPPAKPAAPRSPSFPAFVPPAAADPARPATTDAKPATTDAKPATSAAAKPVATASDKPATSDAAKPATTDAAKPATTDAAKPAAADPAKARASSTASGTLTTDDEPLVPATHDQDDLRAAVGATPRPSATSHKRRAPTADDDDDDDAVARPRNRKTVAVAAGAIAAIVGIAVLVILGRVNSGRYLLLCEAERAVPQQGRSFPPWGEHALAGDQWRPLKIAPETRCQSHETDDAIPLARTYLAMVLDQATALLTAHEVTRLDEAEALLKQALLLTRPPEYEPPPLAAERTEHHKEIERLLGDVTYWRATAKLHDAAAALTEAARQFDSAAAQHPRHAADAPAWATYARKLGEELQGGPTGAPRTVTAAGPAAPATAPAAAPPGVALPVEPARGSAEEPPPATPPDAGVPTGGVLL